VTRAWRLVKFVDNGMLTMTACSKCGGHFVTHPHEIARHYVCGLCNPPARAGKGKYPLRAWRDAPFFPTPQQALQALGAALPLPAGAQVLDAGCGLGHGLRALQRAWPQARLHGVEWSVPMAALCRWRCGFARVQRGDLWVQAWTGFDVVYLFQRPESMARAWTKACAEMAPGTHLVSLEFAVPGVAPLLQLDAGGGRPLWVYRVPALSTKGRRGR
jgi:SAM-dependent methyltransferase